MKVSYTILNEREVRSPLFDFNSPTLIDTSIDLWVVN